MPKRSPLPAIWLAQSDAELIERLAAGVRRDGMTVSSFPSIEPALVALNRDERPAVLVVAPLNGPLTDLEFTEQAKAMAPRVAIIFTPQTAEPSHSQPGAHVLTHPLDGPKLLRFIRLVAGRPAFRSTLQALYREAIPPLAAATAPPVEMSAQDRL